MGAEISYYFIHFYKIKKEKMKMCWRNGKAKRIDNTITLLLNRILLLHQFWWSFLWFFFSFSFWGMLSGCVVREFWIHAIS